MADFKKQNILNLQFTRVTTSAYNLLLTWTFNQNKK